MGFLKAISLHGYLKPPIDNSQRGTRNDVVPTNLHFFVIEIVFKHLQIYARTHARTRIHIQCVRDDYQNIYFILFPPRLKGSMLKLNLTRNEITLMWGFKM